MSTKNILGEVVSWSKAVLFSIAIALVINLFIIQPYTVSGESMEPTFEGLNPHDTDQIGDRVMVYKGPYSFGNEPSIGDVVIIDSRVEHERTIIDELLENPIVAIVMGSNDEFKNNWIKRVVGKAGDKLDFNNGKLYRNGILMDEDYIKENMNSDYNSIVVPENTIFVMGDNRNRSSDSREIGPVPINNIVGKVVIRFYPFDKVTKF